MQAAEAMQQRRAAPSPELPISCRRTQLPAGSPRTWRERPSQTLALSAAPSQPSSQGLKTSLARPWRAPSHTCQPPVMPSPSLLAPTHQHHPPAPAPAPASKPAPAPALTVPSPPNTQAHTPTPTLPPRWFIAELEGLENSWASAVGERPPPAPPPHTHPHTHTIPIPTPDPTHPNTHKSCQLLGEQGTACCRGRHLLVARCGLRPACMLGGESSWRVYVWESTGEQH